MNNIIPIGIAKKLEADKRYSVVVMLVDYVLDWAERYGVDVDLAEIQATRKANRAWRSNQ